MTTYKFGVVGCGTISPTHLKAIDRLPNARTVAVCDIIEERAKEKAEQWDCDWYLDADEMLKRDDIDVVEVLVPSGIHAEIGIRAARAGKHVICTKPIDVTLEAIDDLIAAAAANNVKLGATHQFRDYEIYRKLKVAVNQRRLGKPLYGRALVPWLRLHEYYADSWHGTWELDGGGALMNQSIHYIDLLIWMMGEVEAVCGFSGVLDHDTEVIETEDCSTAAVLFANGAHGIIQGTTCTYRGMEAELGIYGSKGNVRVVGDRLRLWDVEGERRIDERSGDAAGAVADPKAGMPDEATEAHVEQIGDVLAAIDQDRKPRIDGHEARRAVEVILAIYRSSEKREVVELPLDAD